jgi:DNA-binding GntR family transcriptional regulator
VPTTSALVDDLQTEDDVYDRIRRAVVEGRYLPGRRLVEQRLAEEYAVSRTPVREALHRLEAEGLVVVERNRGAQVRPLSHEEIADLYDVRSRLEAYAAELAAERSRPEDLIALTAAATAFEAAVDDIRRSGSDREAVRRLDAANAAFHGALQEASRHTRIRQLVSRATDVPLVFQALRHFRPEELARSALFHHLIAEAVTAREPARASRLMAEHVLQGRDALLRRLGESGPAELFGHSGP